MRLAGSSPSSTTGGSNRTTAGSLYSVVVSTRVPAGSQMRKSFPRLWVCELSWNSRVPLAITWSWQYSCVANGGTFGTKIWESSASACTRYCRSAGPGGAATPGAGGLQGGPFIDPPWQVYGPKLGSVAGYAPR